MFGYDEQREHVYVPFIFCAYAARWQKSRPLDLYYIVFLKLYFYYYSLISSSCEKSEIRVAL